MTSMPQTKTAWHKLTWNLRALLCEKLIGWALAICPHDYTPSCIEGVIEGMRKAKALATMIGGPADGKEVWVYHGHKLISIPIMNREGLSVARYAWNFNHQQWQHISEEEFQRRR